MTIRYSLGAKIKLSIMLHSFVEPQRDTIFSSIVIPQVYLHLLIHDPHPLSKPPADNQVFLTFYHCDIATSLFILIIFFFVWSLQQNNKELNLREERFILICTFRCSSYCSAGSSMFGP